MRVSHFEDEHLISLDSQECSALVDACSMVLIAAESLAEVKLPTHVTRLLVGIYEQFGEVSRQGRELHHPANQSDAPGSDSPGRSPNQTLPSAGA
jgi:hypothetical protein